MSEIVNSPQVRHGVAEALDLHRAQLVVHREVGQVHVARRLDRQPDAPQHVAALRYSEELVLRGGLVEGGDLLVDEEGVRDPDEPDVLCSNHELIDPELGTIESQSGVCPELSEVLKKTFLEFMTPQLDTNHVKCEVHKFFRQVSDGENVESDSDSDRGSSEVRNRFLV